jgi:hypothetical protein
MTDKMIFFYGSIIMVLWLTILPLNVICYASQNSVSNATAVNIGNTTGNTTGNGTWSNIVSQLVVAAPVISFSIAGASAFISLANFYYQRKQYKLNALLQIFNQLNAKEHRDAREKIYLGLQGMVSSPAEYSGLISTNDKLKDNAEFVASDFDQAGALVRNKLVDKNAFLDTYGHTIKKYWNFLNGYMLDKNIITENNKGNFGWLAEQVEKPRIKKSFWQF